MQVTRVSLRTAKPAKDLVLGSLRIPLVKGSKERDEKLGDRGEKRQKKVGKRFSERD